MPIIRFEAKLLEINAVTLLRLPGDASAQLPSRGQVMVKGTINNFPFHTALEPDGRGGHWLTVDKTMQRSAQVEVGDSVALAIESTKDWPEPVMPADWQAALDGDSQVKTLWTDITPMARWEWLRWIDATNNHETRERRIEVSCSKLLAGSRLPCCFNRNMCCVPAVSKNGVLLDLAQVKA